MGDKYVFVSLESYEGGLEYIVLVFRLGDSVVVEVGLRFVWRFLGS